MNTLRELCLDGEGAAAFPPERLARLDKELRVEHHADLPWYLRLIVGIGAWVASLFFLGAAIACMGWENPNRTAIGVMGGVLLPLAVLAGRQSWGVFAEQAALAVSFAAQGMIYLGVIDDSAGGHPVRTALLLSIVLAAVLYVAFPSFLSRLMTCFAALQVTLCWIEWGDAGLGPVRSPELVSLASLAWWAAHLAGITFIFQRPRWAVFLTPLGYALAASLAIWQVEFLFDMWNRILPVGYQPDLIVWIMPSLRVALSGAALLSVIAWAAGGPAAVRAYPGPFLALVAGVVALVYLGLGGVLLALAFVVLGIALQDRPLLGLGLLLFPVFLTHYYYSLNLDLLQKSGVLVASGAVMLALREVVLRRLFAGAGKTEAA